LIYLSTALSERRQELRNASPPEAEVEEKKIQVVVYTGQGRSVGLVVDRILDIAREPVKIQKHSGRPGTLGSMIVQGRVTELIDVKATIQAADPDFFSIPAPA
jgi:two-component system chemotaxis sensor kinase CheA